MLPKPRPSRPGKVQRCLAVTQVCDIYKKRKPLVHLDEGGSKITNKHAKDIQTRNLELSIQACLWLCQKNKLAQEQAMIEDAPDSSEEKVKKSGRLVSRSKTSDLRLTRLRAKDRFDRKTTIDVSLVKAQGPSDSSKYETSSLKEQSETSQSQRQGRNHEKIIHENNESKGEVSVRRGTRRRMTRKTRKRQFEAKVKIVKRRRVWKKR